jgi:putative endonuclease
MLRCSDGSLYTGVTTDLKRRLDEHNSGNGAKYTRSRNPVSPVYIELGHDRSSALSREAEIKSLSKDEKEFLAENA